MEERRCPESSDPPLTGSRRKSMAREGRLIQIGGSHHRWLEDRGPQFKPTLAVYDSTGYVGGALFLQFRTLVDMSSLSCAATVECPYYRLPSILSLAIVVLLELGLYLSKPESTEVRCDGAGRGTREIRGANVRADFRWIVRRWATDYPPAGV